MKIIRGKFSRLLDKVSYFANISYSKKYFAAEVVNYLSLNKGTQKCIAIMLVCSTYFDVSQLGKVICFSCLIFVDFCPVSIWIFLSCNTNYYLFTVFKVMANADDAEFFLFIMNSDRKSSQLCLVGKSCLQCWILDSNDFRITSTSILYSIFEHTFYGGWFFNHEWYHCWEKVRGSASWEIPKIHVKHILQ